MNLTSNFDFAVEMGIDIVREIFHLAFKSEDIYPHNIGPINLTLSGQPVAVYVKALDDETDAADLSFLDQKHILFSIPFEVNVQAPGAPDPSLSSITLKARANVPGKLDNWPENGTDILGINFADITAADVSIPALEGLPTIGIANIMAAIHAKYDMLAHTYSLGTNVLVVYDNARDMSLTPPNMATPQNIEGELVATGGKTYLKVTLPMHASVPQALFESYGKIIFHREVVTTNTTITINMAAEPVAPLDTQVQFDTGGPVAALVATQLKPLAVNAISGFGVVTQPAFTEAAAMQLMQEQIAAYLRPRKYGVYTPQSGDPSITLSTPIGFLLVADQVLAVLMNRRDSSVPDFPPDNFKGSEQIALAVGRARVMEVINGVIAEQFPDLASGSQEIHTDQGDATLQSLSADLSDPGEHGQSDGHVWMSGTAEVHIDCWPDPDVSFEGPIFIDTTLERTDDACVLTAKGRAGDFDIDQSCCDVLLDLLIPIVGWIVLGVTESLIDSVGGALVTDIAAGQSRVLAPIPPVVNGVAQVSACLTSLKLRRDGFIFPGEISLRRITTSFEDLRSTGDQPKP
mgnify:CR=1 FL=1